MNTSPELEIILQLSNIELYVALFGVIVAGLFGIKEGSPPDWYVVVCWRIAAILVVFASVFLVVWLMAALIVRFNVLVGM